ncbi:DUF5074 domain-containing protein [Flavobacterium humi]|uniref:T9SS type A sorting domain-containing protein n=1 Tax=Flavobacterium humi TaxID=2562683 RepID=A0A4Z0L690_9FLAO|nr:DUF5074 domain-containing protein [Flavobacterium humi]TGD56687.1 T9SS type A sorting domain-containing protein [Flavobacterium humi]
MKKNYILSIAFACICSLGFSQSYLDGVFVLNEGNMGSNSASVSFIDKDHEVANNIFAAANNNAPLGDVAQSMGFHGNNAFIVLNYSNAIKVVNTETLTAVASIATGLINPRYIAFYQNKGYVTCWGDGTVTTDDYLAVVNLDTYQVEDTIPMPEGVEHIEAAGGKLYVANQGGYGYGTTLSVVDIVTENVTTIPVGDIPNSMVIKDDYLYVLCGGMPDWSGSETSGALVKINLANNSIASQLPFVNNQHPKHLLMHNNDLYYTLGSGIYKMSVQDTSLPASVFLNTPDQGFLGIYGWNIIDNTIYVADANGFGGSGFAHMYTIGGTFIATHGVGDIPNHFYESKKSALGANQPAAAIGISVYPNPAASVFYLKSDKNIHVKMYDLIGKTVKNEAYSPSGIDVSDLSKGIYVVELSFEGQKQTTKLVVK